MNEIRPSDLENNEGEKGNKFEIDVPDITKNEHQESGSSRNMKRREALRRKRRMRKITLLIKNIFMLSVSILTLIAIILILSNLYKVFVTRRVEKTTVYGEKYAEKNIDLYLSDIEEEPTGRDIAWSSELPAWMEDDMSYLINNYMEYIVYKFGSYEFYMEPYGDTYLYYYGDEGLSNCSIYKNENHIVIYGEDEYERFVRYEISKVGIYSTDVMTENIAVKFSDSEKISDIIYLTYGYNLCIGNDKKTVFLYSDNQQVGDKIILNSEVDYQRICENYTVLYTADNEVYMPYILGNSLHLEKLPSEFNLDSNIGTVEFRDDEMYFSNIAPIIFQENGANVLVPKNKEAFNINQENYDGTSLEWELIPIEEMFIKADINHKNMLATVYLKYGDLIGTFDYRINGYDSNISIPRSETSLSNSYTVFSEEEYWQVIEKIRETYAKYYDRRS